MPFTVCGSWSAFLYALQGVFRSVGLFLFAWALGYMRRHVVALWSRFLGAVGVVFRSALHLLRGLCLSRRLWWLKFSLYGVLRYVVRYLYILIFDCIVASFWGIVGDCDILPFYPIFTTIF